CQQHGNWAQLTV
nr:immunoglobulin light chain junction region [Macaca mulatta]